MRYTQKSFSVPASAGSKAECERVGHTQPDRHGKCLRCAEKVAPSHQEQILAQAMHQGVAAVTAAAPSKARQMGFEPPVVR